MATVEQIIDEARRLSAEEQRRLRVALEALGFAGGAQPAYKTRERERAWIEKHRDEYLGQWIAVENDKLVAHGTNPRQVYLAARDAGIEVPYIVRAERREEPYTGGWL